MAKKNRRRNSSAERAGSPPAEGETAAPQSRGWFIAATALLIAWLGYLLYAVWSRLATM
ncbi:MAG: hypothetical protein QGG36_28815 [Pirellulaceae bacterium]|nr:hypothetical protein [Pirellulaceae bacterium]MDP7019835.1 hypothetical protein [Pirellulaceae bacterium]